MVKKAQPAKSTTQSTHYSSKQKKEDLATLKKDYQTTVNKVKKHTIKLKQQVDTEAKEIIDRIERDYARTKESIIKAKKEFDIKKAESKAFIRKHPFISVTGATLGGILLHKIFRKRRR